MQHFAHFSLLSTVCLLAACGSGGGSEEVERATYSELFDEFETIDAQFDRGNTAAMSDPATLPIVGSATYEGVLGVNVDSATDSNSIIGDMTMTADFQSLDISGQVTNFVDLSEQTYDGTLNISNGGINRAADLDTQFTFVADLDGQLTDESSGEYDVDMIMRGDFYGDNQEFVGGELAGDVDSPDGVLVYDGDGTYFVGQQ